MDKYIEPKIKKFDSFNELIKEREDYGIFEFRFGQSEQLWALMKQKRAFILAEPGYGKTRSLKELAKKSSEDGKLSLFLDIKKVDSESIEGFIKKRISYADKLSKSLDIQKSSFFTSQNFKLTNSDKLVVCLDALDEVDQSIFSKVVENIREFSERYGKVSLYVSCRIHFFRKYADLFESDRFSYIHLSPLFQEEIEEFLLGRGVKRGDLTTIFHTLDFKRDLIIQTPRYLEFLAEFLSKKNIKEISSLKISELFEFFIYRKLETENKKRNQYTIVQINTIKRVLEKLALLMEIHQVNKIKEDDLMTFFDSVDSGLTLGFLQSAPLQLFFERGIIKDGFNKGLGNYFEFENTEFQEYLAAKEILRLGDTNRSLYSLSIDPILKEVYPSWFNALRFVVNLNPSTLDFILNLRNITNNPVPLKEYHYFITKVDPNSLGNEEKRLIFEEVFNYYKKTGIFLDIDLVRNLAYFFEGIQNNFLEKAFEKVSKEDEERFKINQINIIRLVGFIVERDVLKPKEISFWKESLLKIASNKKAEKELRRVSLANLKSFKDEKVLEKVGPILSENINDLTKEIIHLYGELDPNGKDTVGVLVNGTKNGCYIEAMGFLFRFDLDINFVRSFFNFLAKDRVFLSSILEHESIFGEDVKKFIIKVQKIFDKNLWNGVLEIVEATFSDERFWDAERSGLINNLVKVASQFDESFMSNLLDRIEKTEGLQKNIFGLQNVFANSLSVNNAKEFVERLKKIEHGERVALWSFFAVQNSNKPAFREGRKHLKKDYAESEKQAKKYRTQQERHEVQEKNRLNKAFQISLKEIHNPKTKLYHFNALTEFLRSEENKEFKFTKKQRDNLKEICKFVFNKFDPQKADVRIEKDKTIFLHPWTNIFGIALDVAKKLDATDIIDSKIRKRLVSYIPFAYEHQLEEIFSLVDNINRVEIDTLFNEYKKSKGADIWKYRARTIVKVIKDFHLEGYEDLVRGFVDDNSLGINDREVVIVESDSISPDQGFLQRVFKSYKNKKDEQLRLAEKANEILITKYQSPTAIAWRVNQLKSRAFSYIRSEGVQISAREHELDSKEFAAPIFNISKTKPGLFMKEILGLVEESLKIYKKGNEFHAYAFYLWDVVMIYIEHQKIHRSYSPLNDFERFLIKNISSEGANFLSVMFQNIKAKYATYIGKPEDFIECVKKYNALRGVRFEKIANSLELRDVISEILEKDIVKWLVDEGALKVMETLTKRSEGESLIQKILLTQFTVFALKRGFIENEILFRREEELFDGDMTDYLISYGFIGPVLIEIKRTDNGDVTNKKYRSKLLKYMRGTNSEYCIFLIFKIKTSDSLRRKVDKAKDIYANDFPSIKVIGLDCVGNEGLII